MPKTLTPYKLKRIATEALNNALRLHSDAILLHHYGSYPSAFQLSILSLEELAKAKAVAHVHYSDLTNDGDGSTGMNEDWEQKWLACLYSHPWKQEAFIGRDVFDYSPALLRFIQSKDLEARKQTATYVGLPKKGKAVDVNARISTPERIKEKEARRFISLMNAEFLHIYSVCQSGGYFGVASADELIDVDEHQVLFVWPHRSGLRSRRFASAAPRIRSK